MPKLLEKLPKYRKHSSRNVAFVVLGGHRVYLTGPHGSQESRADYKAKVLEWETTGRTVAAIEPQAGMTVTEALAAYVTWAKDYYRDNHECQQIAYALRPLKELYGLTPADKFGPLALKAVRESMIQAGLSRGLVNQRIGRVKRFFRWAVENELIPPSVYHGLQAVRGLSAGRSAAKETEPVKPAPEAHVKAVEPFVSPQVWAMIQLQEMTAMRPGEVTSMRTADLDTSGKVWIFTPSRHKTAYRGHKRQIYIGPRAQAVLAPWLRTNPAEFLFQPCEAVDSIRQQRAANRTTPASCGNRPGTNRKLNPQRKPADRYSVQAYGRAIRRACVKAKVPHWHPHQLRHNAATWLRKEFGLDIARAILGHRSPQITEVYAELDFAKAEATISAVG